MNNRIIEIENVNAIKKLEEYDYIIPDNLKHFNNEKRVIEMSNNDETILIYTHWLKDLHDIKNGKNMLIIPSLFIKNLDNRFLFYFGDINKVKNKIILNITTIYDSCMYDKYTYNGNDYKNYIRSYPKFILTDNVINEAVSKLKEQ